MKKWRIKLMPYRYMPNDNMVGLVWPDGRCVAIHNLGDSVMDSGATSMRGMANPPEVSDSGGKVGDDSMVEGATDKIISNILSGGVSIPDSGGVDNISDDEDDVEYIKRGNGGKVCIRVGEFGDWLRTHEPDTIDEYAHHIRTTASTIPLEQWADIHHPELREIWAIVRYRGDI